MSQGKADQKEARLKQIKMEIEDKLLVKRNWGLGRERDKEKLVEWQERKRGMDGWMEG